MGRLWDTNMVSQSAALLDPVPAPGPAMSQTLQIHARLRSLILGLELAPGERFSERWLESRFEISRTPIRGALARLEAEELVRRDGRHWIVAPIDLGEMAALCELREALESAAVRMACVRASRAEIDALEALLDACPPEAEREDWHRAGIEFHVEIARLSGNRFIVKAIRDAMMRLSRARWLELGQPVLRDRAWREHKEVLNHIRANRPEAAVAGICAHIRETHERLSGFLTEDRRGLRARGVAIVGIDS